VKSILAGLLALIVVPVCLLVIIVVGMVIYVMLHHPVPGEGSIGWDPISLVRMNPRLWAVPVFIFSIGFIWEYRRLAK
jgi:uncharacterized BrkB/YihY/UPF0761 family membrane protein